MKEVVVVGGVRTAIGAFGGSLKDVPVINLGSLVIKAALKKAGLRPQSGEELLNYGPDVLKGLPPIELEKAVSDWDDSLQ
ncbi:MAG: hypothetical protein QJR05_12560, partial [Thermoanaerobacterium sp.]|nr:hypothetical protein [Thermoanaerobacterium sp.]